MKKQLSIIQFLTRLKINLLILVLCPLILVSCVGDEYYVENMLKIESFRYKSDNLNRVHINFDVDYYSDSTIQNYFLDGIEKGNDGSNDSIIYFGWSGNNKNNTDSLSFENFKENYNQNNNMFSGEMLLRDFYFADSMRESSTLIMVRYHFDTREIDTLKGITEDTQIDK